jgi:hypothetical protein
VQLAAALGAIDGCGGGIGHGEINLNTGDVERITIFSRTHAYYTVFISFVLTADGLNNRLF